MRESYRSGSENTTFNELQFVAQPFSKRLLDLTSYVTSSVPFEILDKDPNYGHIRVFLSFDEKYTITYYKANIQQ